MPLSNEQLERQFWRRVSFRPGCWEWRGATDGNGYGQVRRGRKLLSAHRMAYEMTNGPIGEMQVLHRCDNRLCCRPDHLFLGSLDDNMADRNAKGRQAWGIRSGSAKLSEDEVRAIRALCASGVTHRECAQTFGISHATAGNIARRQRWGLLA